MQWQQQAAPPAGPFYPPPQYPFAEQTAGDPFAPQGPPPKRGHGKLIASIAAVIVLVGGGVGTYVALSDSSDNGAATPTAAVQSVFTDLQKADILGVLDDLAPAERDAMAGPLNDQISELKRLHVFDASADLHHLPGFTFSANGLTYGAPKKITDKVDVVPLTGGSIDVSFDASKLPISQQYLDAVGGKMPRGSSSSQHVNIADAPQRPELAVQQVGGRWYPSLFYTIAYNAAGQRAPRPADHIPAAGADSPGSAVGDMVRYLLAGDSRSAIALLSPDEMAVAHDYGGSVKNSPTGNTGISVSKMLTTTTSLSGGAVRVSLKSLVVTSKGGQTFSMSIHGDCISASSGGQAQKFCASDAGMLLTKFAGAACGAVGSCRGGSPLTAAQRRAFEDLFRGLLKIGVVTSQTDGKWYVNPVRTSGDLGNTITSQMKNNDLLEITRFFRRLSH